MTPQGVGAIAGEDHPRFTQKGRPVVFLGRSSHLSQVPQAVVSPLVLSLVPSRSFDVEVSLEQIPRGGKRGIATLTGHVVTIRVFG